MKVPERINERFQKKFLDACLEATKRDVAELAERRDAIETSLLVADVLEAVLPSVYMYSSYITGAVEVSAIIDHPDEIKRVLSIVEAFGLHIEKATPATPGNPRWTYCYEDVPLTLSLSLSGSSKCRFVQVGTESVEKPIFELKCDEEENE